MKIVLIIALLLLIPGCSNKQDASQSVSKKPSNKPPTEETSPVNTKKESSPILISTPPIFASVFKSFKLAGSATAHEGELRWQILGPNEKLLLSGPIKVTCGAPCRGKFNTAVDVRKVPAGQYELHVFQPPVSDDDPLRVNDTITPITITTGPVDNFPPADAPPPGGAPATS